MRIISAEGRTIIEESPTSETISHVLKLMLLAVLIAAIILLIRVRIFVDHLDSGAREISKTVMEKGGLYDRINKAALHADGLAGEAENAAKAAAATSRDEQAFLKAENKKLLATVDKANSLIGQVGGNLNSAAGDFGQIARSLKQDLDDLDPVLKSGKLTLDALTQSVRDIDANLINDPDVKASLASIASILKSTDLTAADFQRIAAYFEKKITAPATKKQKILAVLEMVYKAALIDVALKAK